MRNYLGFACTVHDPAIAIVDSKGEVVFAEASERYLQTKRAFYAVPDDIVRIGRLIERYCEPGAELVAAHSWLERRWKSVLARVAYLVLEKKISPLLLPTMIGQNNSFDLVSRNLEYRRHEEGASPVVKRHYDHHTCHAAAACYSSPFEDAVCAVIDGHGEKGPHSFFAYQGGRLRRLHGARRRRFRHNASLGVFYAGLCLACGFDPIKGEEWKVMGLAPYGKKDPAVYAKLRPMMRVRGLDVIGDNVAMLEAFRGMRRKEGVPALEYADFAFTGQLVFGEICRELLIELRATGISENLVLSGGCALNSSYNGKIVGETGFARLHVNSAPADDGNAVGAAWLAYYEDNPPSCAPARLASPYLGERMGAQAMEHLTAFSGLTDDKPAGVPVHEFAAELLAQGKILGWVQGRAEYGPRALGNRSILADPRRADVKETLNARVKFREEFRPFAPSILHEHGPRYFEDYQDTPYMERTLRFRESVRDEVPGVVHVDGTGRLQSVTHERNPRYHDLIAAFERRTGVPIVLNTSFNVMGKPIIHTVEDAVAVFFTSGIDALVLEDKVFLKRDEGSRP